MGHHRQEHTIDETKGLPALLTVLTAVLHRDIQGIAENRAGLFKAHTVPLEAGMRRIMIVIA